MARAIPAGRAGRPEVCRAGGEVPLILIDTDVLIDVALDRRPHSGPAADILDRLEYGGLRAFIAWHSVSNFYYLTRPALGGASARDFIVELTRFVDIAQAGTDAIRYAAGLPMADFEDAMQVAAAHACGARNIVTKNLRDFLRSPIRAISPEEALAELF